MDGYWIGSWSEVICRCDGLLRALFWALHCWLGLAQASIHAVHEDEFDQRYFREQRELVMKAYEAVRTLRLILANHPATKKHEVPDWLFKGEIWTR